MKKVAHGVVSGALALTALLALPGCAAAPAPAPTVTVVVTPSTMPSPMPTATITVTPVPTEPLFESPVPDPGEPTLDPNAAVAEPVTAYATDLGSQPGATNSPTLDADGTIVSYKVVSKDSFFDIAQRFDIPVQQLLLMNPRVTGTGENLYINQVINLDARTLG